MSPSRAPSNGRTAHCIRNVVAVRGIERLVRRFRATEVLTMPGFTEGEGCTMSKHAEHPHTKRARAALLRAEARHRRILDRVQRLSAELAAAEQTLFEARYELSIQQRLDAKAESK